MKEIPIDTLLIGQHAELQPLTEQHFQAITELGSEEKIWQHYPYNLSDKTIMDRELAKALVEKEKGTQFPFVILSKANGSILGSTRLMDIQVANDKIEIGWTFLHPHYWSGPINPECKWLLMNFCFETLGVARLQLKTDELNTRSRKAILKTGARFEGILRNDLRRDNGTYRNSAYFSITKEEWPEARKQLEAYIQSRNQTI